MNSRNFDGTVILMTASATRTGGAIARYLLSRGAQVYLNYHSNHQGAEELVSEFGPQMARPIQADVTDPASVKALYKKIGQETDRLDGLINVVGDYHEAPILETSFEDYKQVFSNNMDSVFLMCQGAYPLLRKSKRPRVVNFAYAKGERVTSAKAWAYHIAKMGVISFSRSLAAQWGPEQISVNVISPGTLFNSIVMESEDPAEYIPQGRFGLYADLFPIFDLIFREDSTYQTGNNFIVSGGYNV
ncbi:MAG: SDR family oxidoreductase [bacterium]|nr:SDR family oxidoreductase [bacterium]